jgi:hypothetical protein
MEASAIIEFLRKRGMEEAALAKLEENQVKSNKIINL